MQSLKRKMNFFHLDGDNAKKYLENVLMKHKKKNEVYEKFSKNFLILKFNSLSGFMKKRNGIPDKESIILGIKSFEDLKNLRLLWSHRILYEVGRNIEYEITNANGFADILAFGDAENVNLFLEKSKRKTLIYVDNIDVLDKLSKDPDFIAVNWNMRDSVKNIIPSFNSIFGLYANIGQNIQLNYPFNFVELRFR